MLLGVNFNLQPYLPLQNKQIKYINKYMIMYNYVNIYMNIYYEVYLWIFTFMHLADAFIQSDLQYIQAIHILSVCVFPGNWTHNLCTALPLRHRNLALNIMHYIHYNI